MRRDNNERERAPVPGVNDVTVTGVLHKRVDNRGGAVLEVATVRQYVNGEGKYTSETTVHPVRYEGDVSRLATDNVDGVTMVEVRGRVETMRKGDEFHTFIRSSDAWAVTAPRGYPHRNRLVVMGFLGRAPDKVGQGGARLSVATGGFNGAGQPDTQWHSIVVWGPEARVVLGLGSGARVYVEARMNLRVWGEPQRVSYSAVATRVIVLSAAHRAPSEPVDFTTDTNTAPIPKGLFDGLYSGGEDEEF